MAREALFDLAVNRAVSYLRRCGALGVTTDAQVYREQLEPWYLKTRFVYRVPLTAIIAALRSYPTGSEARYHWCGGENGGWCPGDPPTP
jgi:hypothetical protein